MDDNFPIVAYTESLFNFLYTMYSSTFHKN